MPHEIKSVALPTGVTLQDLEQGDASGVPVAPGLRARVSGIDHRPAGT